MRALVVGAGGFAGQWLVRHLTEAGDGVVAMTHHPGDGEFPESVVRTEADVRDPSRIREIVHGARPEAVYYLAGVSAADERDREEAVIEVGVIGAINTLRACAGLEPRIRLVHVGSSHVYAAPADEQPLSEASLARPTTPYGAGKLAAESALLALGPALGVDVVAARPFNHAGPGQSRDFVIPGLAHQIAEVRRGRRQQVVAAGDLDVARDFTDVRDVVRAYRLMAVSERPGELYNVASGIATPVRTVIQMLADAAGLEFVPTRQAASHAREEPSAIAGDAGKLRSETGWQPQIPLATTLADVLSEYLHDD